MEICSLKIINELNSYNYESVLQTLPFFVNKDLCCYSVFLLQFHKMVGEHNKSKLYVLHPSRTVYPCLKRNRDFYYHPTFLLTCGKILGKHNGELVN